MGMMITLSVAVSLTLVRGGGSAANDWNDRQRVPSGRFCSSACDTTNRRRRAGGRWSADFPARSRLGQSCPRWRLYKNSSGRPMQHNRSRD
jgi:hypothetical protein